MQKMCLSCGTRFTLSGSGRPQKHCPKCRQRGRGKVSHLSASKPLKTKGAKTDIWTPIPPGESGSPIHFTTLEEDKGRIWTWEPRTRVKGEEIYWRSAIAEAIKIRNRAKERAANRSKFDKPVDLMNGTIRSAIDPKLRQSILDTEQPPPLKGFLVRLVIQDEAPTIGSGQRLVLCQFRGKRVLLYHWPVDGLWTYSASIRRDAFKELVASNKRYRKRNRIETPAALLPATPAAPAPTTPQGTYTPEFTEVLKGDDYPIEFDADGDPIMPACLRRKPELKLVVNNKPTDTAKETAA